MSWVVPKYCWVLSPQKDFAEALVLRPQTVPFRNDYLRAFCELFASSRVANFTPKLDCVPGAMFPSFFLETIRLLTMGSF